MAAGTSAGVAAGSPASASVGGGAPGLSQEAIDNIVNAASNEEERKLMAAVAATASADDKRLSIVLAPLCESLMQASAFLSNSAHHFAPIRDHWSKSIGTWA